MMKDKKDFVSILMITLILLVAGARPTPAWSLSRQTGSHEQDRVAATSGGSPIGLPFLITDQLVDTEYPVVVYNSQEQEYLVVWDNDRPANDDIYGQRVSKTGALIGSYLAIAYGVGFARYLPRVAYNSQQNEYLVIWDQLNNMTGDFVGVRGQRLSGTGQRLGGELDIAVSTSSVKYQYSSVAYDSTDDMYLVVYTSRLTATNDKAVIAQALNSDGSAWGSSFEIAPNATSPRWTDLAYNPLRNEFLVTWDQIGIYKDVMARRVKMTGGAGVLGSIFTISSDTSNDNYSAHVAALSRSPDGQYLVVWEHCTNSGCVPVNTLAQLVSGEVKLEGGNIQLPTPFSYAIHADVAECNSSSSYFVTWMQTNTGSTGLLAGRFVSVGGQLQPDFWLAGDLTQRPAAACGPLGDYLVVFNYTTPTTNLDVWGRLVGNRVYLPLTVK